MVRSRGWCDVQQNISTRGLANTVGPVRARWCPWPLYSWSRDGHITQFFRPPTFSLGSASRIKKKENQTCNKTLFKLEIHQIDSTYLFLKLKLRVVLNSWESGFVQLARIDWDVLPSRQPARSDTTVIMSHMICDERYLVTFLRNWLEQESVV